MHQSASLLGRAELVCICNFTKANQCICQKILTYNFATLLDFRHTQIITYKRIIHVLATRSSSLNHIKIIHYDPDPLLDLNHQH